MTYFTKHNTLQAHSCCSKWWNIILFLWLSNISCRLSWQLSGKETVWQCRKCGFDPWVRKICWRRKWQPTPVGKSYWQKEAGRLQFLGYSLWRSNESESCSVVSDSLQPHGLYSPWNSPGQHTGVGSHFLLQGIFSTQGSNPGLLHCR